MNLQNKLHPLYSRPTWMGNIELVSSIDTRETERLKEQLNESENNYKSILQKKHEVLQKNLLLGSELRVKRRALQLDQLEPEQQSLLLYAFQKEKDEQNLQNEEFKKSLSQLEKEEAEQNKVLTEQRNALKSILLKYTAKHKKEIAVDEIYSRFEKDQNLIKCFISYAPACHNELFHGFIHVFEDELIFETIILKGKNIKIPIKNITLVKKKTLYESPDAIEVQVKNGSPFVFFGIYQVRDDVAECIINALALQGQE